MYIYIYIYLYMHIYIYIYIYMHTHTHHTHTRTHARARACAHTQARIYPRLDPSLPVFQPNGLTRPTVTVPISLPFSG